MEHLNKTNIYNYTKRLEKIIEKRKLANKIMLYRKNIYIYSLIKDFINKKNLLIYGGVAINSILPKKDRFYEKYDIPDIDFFSYRAKEDAIELVEYLASKKIKYVEVRAGIHYETFKIYIQFISFADITGIPKYLFDKMLKLSNDETSMIKKLAPDYDIKVAPLGFLRLTMHIELSRPDGYIERWIKVYKRMTLLYDYYPIHFDNKCKGYERDPYNRMVRIKKDLLKFIEKIKVPILGVEAIKLYLIEGGFKIDKDYILHPSMTVIDIISIDYVNTTNIIIEYLNKYLISGEKLFVKESPPLNKSELLPKHNIIYLHYNDVNKVLHKRPIITIYNSVACYSYKIINNLMVASIDSNLSFVYAWLLTNRIYLNEIKIKCILSWLLHVQYKNLEGHNKIFHLFEQKCYGNQPQLDDIRKNSWDKNKDIIIYRPH